MGLIAQIPIIDETNKDNGTTIIYNETEDKLEYQEFPVSMRGVAVFVSATEPTDKQINDIWIKI